MNIIQLTDSTSGARAKIAPALGFNCFSFEVECRDGRLELLWSDRGYPAAHLRPSASGIPILFPFPGRIRGTSFNYNYGTYLLEEGDGCGNAIHGFVHTRGWRVVEQSASRVVGQFQASEDDPSLLERWPGDFRITLTYDLVGKTLCSRVLIENPSDREIPVGFGTHAYFRVPLGNRGSAADCEITVPVTEEWVLVDLVPTGRKQESEGIEALSRGLPLGNHVFDSCYTGLRWREGRCVTQVHDPRNRRRVRQTVDKAFSHCVVYTPPHREAVCLEPYTCIPHPFQLEAEGIATGLRRLGAGERLDAAIDIEFEEMV